MDATRFLKLILPSRGLYIGLAKRGNERRQRVFNTIAQLVEWEEGFNAYGWDVYHALASFAHPHGAIQADGKRAHPRSAGNALAYRALWCDGDCKVSHSLADYNTQMEVYEASLAFSRDARIPYPLPVNSGGGLHSYWPVREDMDPVLWKRLADALKRAHLRFRYHFDAKVTANGAQVLRTPGFRHQRLGVQVQIGELIEPYDVSQFMHLLENEDVYRAPSVSSRQASQSGSSIARSISDSLRPSSSDPGLVLRNCVQIRRILTEPSRAREPEHRLAAGALKACNGGGAFYLNALDPEWREEGQRKLDGWRVGPPYCGSFESERPGCTGCLFFDASKQGDERFKISSPVHAGRIIVRGEKSQVTQSAPDGEKVNGHNHPLGAIGLDLSDIKLPWPFAWHEDHLVRWLKDPADKDAKPLIVSHHPIYLASIHHSEADHNVGCALSFRQWLPHEGWKTITVSAADMWNSHALPKLADGHANILQSKEFNEYVARHINMLRESNLSTAQYEQCGWKIDPSTGKRIGFLTGSSLLTRSKCEEVVVSDELHRRAQKLGPTGGGNIHDWRTAIEQYIPSHDWAGWWLVLASLGTPFISWQHPTESGGIVNIRDIASGSSKTSRLAGSASVWGLWEACLIRNYDTDASGGHILSTLNHLPCFQDELDKKLQGSRNPEWLGGLTNRLTEGGDKQRMEMGGKKLQVSLLPYQLQLITATNHPLHDYAKAFGRGSNAIEKRILELRSQFQPHLSATAHEALQRELFKNAGWTGYYFIEWLLQSDENMAFAEDKLKWWSEWLYKHTNFKHPDRFIVRSIAAAATAGEVAVKMGGMLPCDFRWVIEKVLEDLRALTGLDRPDDTARAGDGITALGDFYAAFMTETLTVPGPYMAGTTKHEPPLHKRPRNRLVFRHEESNQRLLFTQKDFRNFCIETSFSYSDCLQSLEKSGAMIHRDRICVLTAGTTYSGSRQRCIEIDMSHPAVIGLPRLVEASNDR